MPKKPLVIDVDDLMELPDNELKVLLADERYNVTVLKMIVRNLIKVAKEYQKSYEDVHEEVRKSYEEYIKDNEDYKELYDGLRRILKALTK